MSLLESVKRHLRVLHDLEDEDIQEKIDWAKNDVIEAVYDSYDKKVDKDGLQKDTSYRKAVTLLATHYYENRLLVSEVNIHESPYSVVHAIQTLRAHRDRYFKDDDT